MRQLILSAVLALALPVAASASSVTSAHDTLGGIGNAFSRSGAAIAKFDLSPTTALSVGLLNASAAISPGDANIVVPEPGTLGLLGTGLIGIAGLLRRKWNKQTPKT